MKPRISQLINRYLVAAYGCVFFSTAPFSNALADREAPPRDYKQVTKNGQYILVMLAPPWDYGPYDKKFWEDPNIRKIYHSSGLYRNDGSINPLWVVDWYSREVYVSRDGKYAVRFGPWPRLKDTGKFKLLGISPGPESLKELALAIYENGNLRKSYTIADLIVKPGKLPVSVSHFQWKVRVSFDDATGKLKIETRDGQKIFFDIRSGEIVEKIS